MKPLLSVEGLRVDLPTEQGVVQAVREIDIEVVEGETLAVVGESGCGKTMTALALMGLLPNSAERSFLACQWQGKESELNELRDSIAMVFQQPLTALNPTMKVGDQIAEVLQVRGGLGRKLAWQGAVELLQRMQVPRAEERARQYPFQFSGGMLQRVMIAMAVAMKPKLLIADEPTTALDVTVQAQVLALLQQMQREEGMALLLITHDLGVVARMAQRVAVMYAGKVVEQGPVDEIFYRPGHPYTEGLRAAVPTGAGDPLQSIPGTPPSLVNPPAGCGYCARCPYAMNICVDRQPDFYSQKASSHDAACWRHAVALVGGIADG